MEQKVPDRKRVQAVYFYVYKGQQQVEVTYGRRVKLIFTGGHISFVVAFKGLNVVLGLYKCNYSLTVKRELSVATR